MLETQYKKLIATGQLKLNTQQLPVIKALDELLAQTTTKQANWWQKLFATNKPLRGVYVWGSVGCGKTMLMDMFYAALDVPKRRIHFHAFMRYMQQQLFKRMGTVNPIAAIVAELATQVKALCFDEFVVDEIGDAMILAQLLQAMFNHHILLVTTSNTAPENLYQQSLQRDRFLPAIALLKNNCTVIHLETGVDYRRQHIENIRHYFHPINKAAKKNMLDCFAVYAGNIIDSNSIRVCNRDIRTIKQSERCIWFDFSAICGDKRSQLDYLDLAAQYNTILISNVPQFGGKRDDDIALRFIKLVDIFYDNQIRLIVSAAVAIDELYKGNKHLLEFKRTRSRLIELT